MAHLQIFKSSRNLFFLLLFYSAACCSSLHAQVKPIINNGFLSEQGWGSGIHPSGDYFVRADRSVIHAYYRPNRMLFQTFQSPCIADEIRFTSDGRFMIVITSGEISEHCYRVLVYDFFSGKLILNESGYYIENLAGDNYVYLRAPSYFHDPRMGDPDEVIRKYDLNKPAKPLTEYSLSGSVSRYYMNDTMIGSFYSSVLPEELKGRHSFDMVYDSQFRFERLHALPPDDSTLAHEAGETGHRIIIDFSRLYVYKDYVIHKNEEGISIHNLQTMELLKGPLMWRSFSMNFLKAEEKLVCLNSEEDSLCFLCFRNNLHIETYAAPWPDFNHFLALNDSLFWLASVSYNNAILFNIRAGAVVQQRPLGPGDLVPELRGGWSYYGSVSNDAGCIIHNKSCLIDLRQGKLEVYDTYIDRQLIHPGIVYSFPLRKDRLVINGTQWNLTRPDQFEPFHYPTRQVNMNDSDIIAVKKIPNRQQHIFTLYNRSQVFNTAAISYPFDSIEDPGYGNNNYNILHPAYYPWQWKDVMLFRAGGNLLTYHDGITYLSSPFFKWSLYARQEQEARNFIYATYSYKRIYELNKGLPLHVMPYAIRSSEAEFYNEKMLHYPYKKPGKNDLAWLYEPVRKRQAEQGVVTKDREQAKEDHIGRMIKVSYSGPGPEPENQYYIINILDDYIPDLSYAGIYGDIDRHFQDIAFPISYNRLMALNYAHGTIKLMDEKGDTILQTSLYRGGEFIHVTPDGYYFASKNKLSRISIRKDTKVYPLEQFDLKYNRPDIILRRLGCTDSAILKAYHHAYLKRLRKMNFTESMLGDDFHIPEVKIENLEKLPNTTGDDSIVVNLVCTDSLYPLDRINIRNNEVAVYGISGIPLPGHGTGTTTARVSIPLARGMNQVSISVLNRSGAESYRATFKVECTSGKEKPDMYILSIGESRYMDTAYNLSFAAKDAGDIIELCRNNKNYGQVKVLSLFNEQVTKENILNTRSFLQSADINDEVMIFYAGHGLLDDSLNYFLATYDISFTDPARRGMPYDELEDLLDGIRAQKKLLLIDACHSGEVDGDEPPATPDTTSLITSRSVGRGGTSRPMPKLGLTQSTAFTKNLFLDLRKGNGATVISAAGGREFAREGIEWNNGLFTYCILNGIKSMEADLDQDGQIMLSELQVYVSIKVASLSGGKQQPTSRVENNMLDRRIW